MGLKILIEGASEADRSIIKNTLNEICVLSEGETIEVLPYDAIEDVDKGVYDFNIPNLVGLKKLNERSSILNAIILQAPIGIALSYNFEPAAPESNAFISINPMFEKITGRTKEDLLELGWAKITHPDDLEEDMAYYKRLQSGEIKSYSLEKRLIKPDGSIVWVYLVGALLILPGEQKPSYICLIQDISKRKEMEKELAESERSKSVLLSHLPGMAYRCNFDRERTMQFVSKGCHDLTGYDSEDLLFNKKLSYNDIIAPEYKELVWEEWHRILAARQPFKYEYEIITASGERKWVLEMGQGIFTEDGEVEALEGIIMDISERRRIEDNLRYNNEHDAWTGLYNRRYLEQLLEQDARGQLTEKRAIISINLSSVQILSMTYGFHYAQELIKRVADALKLLCNHNYILFNTYENRFVFYAKNYKDKEELAAFCRAIGNTLESILVVERIGCGIGVIEINESNKDDVGKLLKNLLITSEKAVNMAERDINICFFDEELETKIIREAEINHELTQIAEGSDDNSLFLQFQPIFDVKQNQICGFEALARLNSRKLGLISPLEFIPIAEKTKLMVPVGEKIIQKALQFLKRLKENGYDTISIAINISAIQLLRANFTKNLFEMITKMQANPANICLEITESIFTSNYQEVNRILGELKSLGLRIAIDDFGTGYSSLARERELNINCLKIDKYFIDKLLLIKPEDAITGDIISMAHKLGHYVVAEGVEDERQAEYLARFGCDKIQGYLVGKPLNEDAAIELLRKYKQEIIIEYGV
ncbi:MAG TPA: EAL domain-containing protein [Clostridiaceae bacterium]|nr:EAL domain-containing protein [Clostridiaceae bacterium]